MKTSTDISRASLAWLRRFAAALAMLAALVTASRARAQSCTSSNVTCRSADGTAAKCNDRVPGTICVDTDGVVSGGIDGACRFPCALPSDCSLGETCTTGQSVGGSKSYCKPVPFTVDLNLVDSAISYFVNGDPIVIDPSSCALNDRLATMLDQTGDGLFTIDDVDQVIRAFLSTPACDPTTRTCPQGLPYCDTDDQCGRGLYCDAALHRCARDCGIIVDRNAGGASSSTGASLERQCFERMTVCNYERGRCDAVDPSTARCQVDRDCPAAAYCMLGTCAPTCYRNTDCPGTNWYCDATNRCRPEPPASAGTTPFDPRDYRVLFGARSLALDPVNDTFVAPLVIMDTQRQTQVFSAPQVVFGYRLELNYALKLDPKCNDLTNASSDVRADCLISPDKEFLTLDSPFGTLYADGNPGVSLRVNQAGVQKLSPGTYQATLTAIFSTGTTDSVQVTFQKASPDGEYDGQLSVYGGAPDNLIGTSEFAMRLSINDKAAMVKWADVLAANNLPNEQEFTDITEGYPVEGLLHGNATQIFNNPASLDAPGNEIAVKGIYSPQLGRIHLVSVIDLAANFCRSLNGACTGAAGELQTHNPFGRAVRRYMQFLGPFDAKRNTFSGVYREALSGLAPYTVTLDGGFRLNQVKQDDTAIGNWGTPLVSSPATVPFPAAAALQAAASALVTTNCTAADPELAASASPAAFQSYLKASTWSLDQFVVFESYVSNALKAMASPGQGAISVFDYMRGQLPMCSATVTTGCINGKKLRCEVGLFEKAMVSGWVDPGTLSGNANTLFCMDSTTGDCATPPTQNAALAAYHAHDRAYQSLVETLAFGAAADLSDAFYVLYKQQTDFGQSTAFAYQQDRLTAALALYDDALSQFVSPLASSVLFNWPMVSFQGRGDAWIQQAHSLVNDRMEAMMDLFDGKRRLIQSTNGADRVFADHFLQNEYLIRAFFFALEQDWEAEHFVYTGGFDPDHPSNPLARGDLLLAKVDDSRNPLGLRPDRVYFENSTRGKANWQNYRDALLDDLNGNAVQKGLQTYVDQAKAQMQGALSDQANLQGQLTLKQQELDSQIEALCGDDTAVSPLPTACDQDEAAKQLQTSCNGGSCGFPYQCEGDDCDQVVQQWSAGLKDVSCRADTDAPKLLVAGAPRTCVRGKVGALLEERAALRLQRKQTVGDANSLLRQLGAQLTYLGVVHTANQDVQSYLSGQDKELIGMETALAVAQTAFDSGYESANAGDCWIIAGVAAGTNCVGTAVSTALKVIEVVAKHAAEDGLTIAMQHDARMKEQTLADKAATKEEAAIEEQIETTKAGIENILDKYQTVQQQVFANEIQIQDSVHSAQLVAAQYSAQVTDIVGHLVGRESGSVLVENRMVQDANDRFASALVDAYKLSHAFVHRFNLSTLQASFDQQLYQAATVADLQKFAQSIDTMATQYCGAQGLDCDYINNSTLFSFDFAHELFPQLRPIVDGNTGAVLSTGQQFHAQITSSPYWRKQPSAGGDELNLEIPFAIWANDMGANAVERFMLPQNDCNQVIVGDTTSGNAAGTIALQVRGANLPTDNVKLVYPNGSTAGALQFYLKRGGTDYARACDLKTTITGGMRDFVINTYTVGPAPQSLLNQAPNPPAFVTQSSVWPSWTGSTTPPDTSFLYFARDRTLAAPDWVLVVPDVGGSQRWVLGQDVDPTSLPVIEDLVLYVRYNARAMSAQ